MHLTDDLLNEYLDEALPADAHAGATAHLAGCPECAARLESLRALFATLAALPEAPLPRDLSAGVLSRLPQSQPEMLPALNWVFAAQAIAAIGLLAIAAPFVVTSLAGSTLVSAGLPVSQFLTDLVAGLQAQWMSLLGAFGQWLGQTVLGIRATTAPLASVSSVLLGVVAAGLGLLWLIGNGVLLRSTLTTRSH
jgi:hypothetical protein